MSMTEKENILLMGFMGSGKSTMGIRLSYKLQMSVEDTDKMIEAAEGMSVSDIFAKKGENYFRKKETELLVKISKLDSKHIYSLGGGTPIQIQNQGLIKKCGTVIYLRAKPETIYERLKGDSSRPLLLCDDPLSRIKSLIEQRDPIYERCADIIVDVDGREQPEVLEEILIKLGKES